MTSWVELHYLHFNVKKLLIIFITLSLLRQLLACQHFKLKLFKFKIFFNKKKMPHVAKPKLTFITSKDL